MNTCFSPINPGFCYSGTPAEDYINFYKRRLGSSIGITWLGNVTVLRDGATTDHTPFISSAIRAIEELQSYADSHDGFIGIQISHCPAYNSRQRHWKAPDPVLAIAAHRDCFSRLKATEIANVLEATSAALELLNATGIKMVQLHAAHGYFFHQLTSPFLNLRSDSFAWNGRDTLEFLAHFRSQVRHAAVRLTRRVSCIHEYATHYACQLHLFVSCGFELVDVSNGISWLDKNDIYPRAAASVPDSIVEADAPTIFVVNGRIAPEAVASSAHERVMFGAGRWLIADPDYFAKILAGNQAAIRYCRLHGHCHYFTRSKVGVTCPVFSKSP